MNKEGYEILTQFHEKLKKISPTEKRKIEKTMGPDGTFVGAAWAYFKNARYSPAKPKTKNSPKKSKRLVNTARIPYVKELEHGIRTILFKTSKPQA